MIKMVRNNDEDISKFLEYLYYQKNLSESTIYNYNVDIRKFLEFIKKDSKKINQTDIMIFLSDSQRKGYKNATINRRLSSIKTYMDYLLNTGKIEKNPTLGLKFEREERNIPEVLDYNEVEALLDAPDLNTDLGTRDKAILELIYGLGLKVSDIVNLNIDDVDLVSEYIVKKRNDSKMYMPMNDKSLKAVKEYIDYIRYTIDRDSSDALFLNRFGKRLSRQSIWKMIKGYGKKVGINKNINTIILRHSFAVHMLENGVNIEQIKDILGHESIATTQIYRKKTEESFEKAFKKLHPR
ncbi:MAG: tyrosine-type recombinase/integrase [Andreesenia angusta]|nr:tyrosine-type recombinase/integrase [Andreesenia angusta]